MIFMDKEDFTQLSDGLMIASPIMRQVSDQELQEIIDLSENVSKTMAAVSLSMLIVQLILYLGLKYLWNLMNLLQFLIFMQMW